MPKGVRLWAIRGGKDLEELPQGQLELEARIEEWLAKDISIISDDLLVIGRQVETDYGGIIDLLCLNSRGDIVILELKRDKTPREITAQILDYASWVSGLSNDRITDLANAYLAERGPLDEAFGKQFGTELPETLNSHHEMLIVASMIDGSSERIINYLSDSYGVNINAVTFHYFRDKQGQEILGRVFLVDPGQVERQARERTSSKRAPNLSREELQAIAVDKGVEELYQQLVSGLASLFDRVGTTRTSIAFIGRMGQNYNTIFSLVPNESGPDRGLRYQVYAQRLAEYLGIEKGRVASLLPEAWEEWKGWVGATKTYSGYAGFFRNAEEVREFLGKLEELGKKPQASNTVEGSE